MSSTDNPIKHLANCAVKNLTIDQLIQVFLHGVVKHPTLRLIKKNVNTIKLHPKWDRKFIFYPVRTLTCRSGTKDIREICLRVIYAYPLRNKTNEFTTQIKKKENDLRLLEKSGGKKEMIDKIRSDLESLRNMSTSSTFNLDRSKQICRRVIEELSTSIRDRRNIPRMNKDMKCAKFSKAINDAMHKIENPRKKITKPKEKKRSDPRKVDWGRERVNEPKKTKSRWDALDSDRNSNKFKKEERKPRRAPLVMQQHITVADVFMHQLAKAKKKKGIKPKITGKYVAPGAQKKKDEFKSFHQKPAWSKPNVFNRDKTGHRSIRSLKKMDDLSDQSAFPSLSGAAPVLVKRSATKVEQPSIDDDNQWCVLNSDEEDEEDDAPTDGIRNNAKTAKWNKMAKKVLPTEEEMAEMAKTRLEIYAKKKALKKAKMKESGNPDGDSESNDSSSPKSLKDGWYSDKERGNYSNEERDAYSDDDEYYDFGRYDSDSCSDSGEPYAFGALEMIGVEKKKKSSTYVPLPVNLPSTHELPVMEVLTLGKRKHILEKPSDDEGTDEWDSNSDDDEKEDDELGW